MAAKQLTQHSYSTSQMGFPLHPLNHMNREGKRTLIILLRFTHLNYFKDQITQTEGSPRAGMNCLPFLGQRK